MPEIINDYPDSQLYKMRHSAAHLLASVVLRRFPEAKLGVGPPTEDGFYYDFLMDSTLTADDLKNLEADLRAEIAQSIRFEREVVTQPRADEILSSQPLKLELLRDISEGIADPDGGPGGETSQLTVYRSGDFVDLCQGPHVESSSELDPAAVALLRVSGAYWRGDERNPQLQRVYGTAFETPDELERHLAEREAARERDHRRIGEDLRLWTFADDVGRGLPLWMPAGTVIRDELENWARETEGRLGYQRVATPHITKSALYYTSGHLPYYEDDLYAPIDIDGEEYYLKPMNCPHHHMIFAAQPRSYRELPLRITEYGTVYRYEKSGELFGLMRARGFTQNDAHIYCRKEQAADEFMSVMRLHAFYYEQLGIADFHMVLALRDPKNVVKYHGDDEMWEEAESLTRQAMENSEIPYVVEIGGAAHYGPKVDFMIRSATGKAFAASTNQVDLYMPERFDLEYTNQNGEKDRPVIIHRAPLGSHERFVAFLAEHYNGAFPTWLAPVQVRILPITDAHSDFADELAQALLVQDIRAEVAPASATLGARIREASTSKVPFAVILGDAEEESSTVSVRVRGDVQMNGVPRDKFLTALTDHIATRTLSPRELVGALQ